MDGNIHPRVWTPLAEHQVAFTQLRAECLLLLRAPTTHHLASAAGEPSPRIPYLSLASPADSQPPLPGEGTTRIIVRPATEPRRRARPASPRGGGGRRCVPRHPRPRFELGAHSPRSAAVGLAGVAAQPQIAEQSRRAGRIGRAQRGRCGRLGLRSGVDAARHCASAQPGRRRVQPTPRSGSGRRACARYAGGGWTRSSYAQVVTMRGPRGLAFGGCLYVFRQGWAGHVVAVSGVRVS